MIYTRNNGNPSTNGDYIIPDGWYTKNANGYQVLTESGTYWVLEVMKIVNGRIVKTKEVTQY